MRWLTLTLALVSLSACAEYDMVNAQYERFDGEDDTAEGWDDHTTLRVDVHPDQVDADEPLLSQSFWVPLVDGDLDSGPVDLPLAEPVFVSGYVTAYEVSPWSGADLPGQDEAVQAQVAIRQALSAQSQVIDSDPETGWFGLRVVPDEGYTVAVSPDSTSFPAALLEVDILDDLDLDLDLGQGVPIYGRVTHDDGSPMELASVYAVTDGLQTARAQTDAEGWYVIQVQEGLDWSVVCLGGADLRDPTLTSEPMRVSGDYQRYDFAYGDLDMVTVSGRVVDAGGLPAEVALVRLVAESLDGYPEGTTLEREVSTGSNGNFDITVVPGTWTIEVMPGESQLASEDITRSPVALESVHVVDDLSLGRIDLPLFTTLSGIVTDTDDLPVAGAVIRFTEVGFDQTTWSVHTSEDGTFSTEVPQVELDVTLTPPSDRVHDLAMTRLTLDPTQVAEPNLRLQRGQRLRGTALGPDRQALPWALVEVRSAEEVLLAVTVTDDQGQFDVGVAP